MARWTAPRMWENKECWIIGGGPSVPYQFSVPRETIHAVMSGALSPSAYSPYLEPIHGKHIIGINNAYQLGAWIDVVFFGDCAWYLVHRIKLSDFCGLKVTCCPRFAKRPEGNMEGLKYLEKDANHRQGITTHPSKVSWNTNSGAAAISLAHHFGSNRIILLGFDMCMDSDFGKSHWHGSHGRGRKPPPFERHMRGFERIAVDAEALGIQIINASMSSQIKQFPKVPVEVLL